MGKIPLDPGWGVRGNTLQKLGGQVGSVKITLGMASGR